MSNDLGNGGAEAVNHKMYVSSNWCTAKCVVLQWQRWDLKGEERKMKETLCTHQEIRGI